MSDTIELKNKGLNQLIKAFKGKLPIARVGILGGSARGEGQSNATIGAVHEFGSEKMPIRSFLRMPLTEMLESKIENSGAYDPKVLKEVIRTGSIVPWVAKLGILGEEVVQDAFNTGGFGKWKPSNMSYKKNHQTLVESHQLRDSITSDVVE